MRKLRLEYSLGWSRQRGSLCSTGRSFADFLTREINMIEQLARSRIFISHAEVLSIIYSNRGASASRVWLVWILAPWGRRFEHEQLFSRSWSAGEADQVAGAFQRIREQLGPVDLLINNASAGGPYLGCPNQAD